MSSTTINETFVSNLVTQVTLSVLAALGGDLPAKTASPKGKKTKKAAPAKPDSVPQQGARVLAEGQFVETLRVRKVGTTVFGVLKDDGKNRKPHNWTLSEGGFWKFVS